MAHHVAIRGYAPGMGDAVADRTINRRIFTQAQREALGEGPLRLSLEDPLFADWANAAELSEFPFVVDSDARFQTEKPELRSEAWTDVAKRVAAGNASLTNVGNPRKEELVMRRHLMQGSILMSGRHLQHGDKNQSKRPMEVFTNCSTAATSFLLEYLLLNGSGVGRAYDDMMMRVDWNDLGEVHVVVDADYADREKTEMSWDESQQKMVERKVVSDEVKTPEQVKAALKGDKRKVTWFVVPDSRGGWAKAIEQMERMAYEKRRNEVLVLDFSMVRPKGSPIRGMQNRPSSGPGPLMDSIIDIAKVAKIGASRWKATMMVDHYLARCVLVGGARRAARMATKTWRDKTIFEFIFFKRKTGFWSSNNSVTIDQEFRDRCQKVAGKLRSLVLGFRPGLEGVEDLRNNANKLFDAGSISEMDLHAWKVLLAIAEASYFDGTGEPGIINQDRLHANDEGVEAYVDGLYAQSKDFAPDPASRDMMRDIAKVVTSVTFTMITNPCGEITLLMLGAYCVIADVVPFHAFDDQDAEEAFRIAVRALIRTNLMDCLYNREVRRTNRIGVGMTGFHEWAYDRFSFTWADIIDEEKSREMWLMVSRFKRAVVEEATRYAKDLGVSVPHTNTTFKPAGTTSKLFGLTEGAHLPSRRWYLRWVQFRNDDPLVETYRERGYPVRQLKTYDGTTIVGFPTEPTICQLGDGEWVTTAGEATPEEQYQFIRLLEKYWIVGVEADGVTPLENTGNQISYTMKYDPKKVDFAEFLDTLMEGQFSIRCCSVMPQMDEDEGNAAHEYLPEEPISHARFQELMAAIDAGREDIGFEHVDCASGACPVDFKSDAA